MGSPKFSIGGIDMPLGKKTRFSFDAYPLRSGGFGVIQVVAGQIERIDARGLPGRSKILTRLTIDNFLGRKKKISFGEDWVQVGDRIFRAAGPKKAP